MIENELFIYSTTKKHALGHLKTIEDVFKEFNNINRYDTENYANVKSQCMENIVHSIISIFQILKSNE